MKRLISFIILVLLILNFNACANLTTPGDFNSPSNNSEPAIPNSHAPLETTHNPTIAVSMPATTISKNAADGTQLFYYTSQTMHLTTADAEIADRIIMHYLNFQDTVQTHAEDIYNASVLEYSGNNNWTPYACQVLLSPVRLDNGVLSLFGTQMLYNGSGHPYRAGVAINYDLTTGDPLTLGSIMNANATVSQFSDLVISELASHANDLYLYEDFADTVALKFSGEESLFETFYFTSSGLCFYFDLYEIAPYSAGIISIELPYEKLVGLIHDAYFPAERDYIDSTLAVSSFSADTANQYSSITEANLSADGTSVIFHTDSHVDNIRIQSLTEDPIGTSYISFAASSLHRNEAIVVTASAQQFEKMVVTYQTASGVQSLTCDP